MIADDGRMGTATGLGNQKMTVRDDGRFSSNPDVFVSSKENRVFVEL
jgi:hypothetical protein